MEKEVLEKILKDHLEWLNNSGCCKRADLKRADLSGADLSGADLKRADLSGAYLSGAYLSGAYLSGADLSNTILDPNNKPNMKDVELFEKDGEFVIGYRTRKAGHIDMYRDGRFYSADIFSTCEITVCHPGLYIWPTLDRSNGFSGYNCEKIKVRTKPSEIHKADIKW